MVGWRDGLTSRADIGRPVGGGSGQIAATIAKQWDAQVVTLEPWTDGKAILAYAAQQGVENRVLPLRIKAQAMPFPDNSFDAIISIDSFEMIGEERPVALKEMIRVARPGARIGIAEPMCLSHMPEDLCGLDERMVVELPGARAHWSR